MLGPLPDSLLIFKELIASKFETVPEVCVGTVAEGLIIVPVAL